MLAAHPFPNNLPLALSTFIGRGREIEAVKRLLETTRTLTLTGAGGSGKTRLALWVAGVLGSRFAHGAWLVELAPLSDPGLIPQTVAAALGLREPSGRPVTEHLAETLRHRQLLLVLDNCEHLLAASAQLAEALLRACPGLRLLATSREPLNLAGETVWLVPALSVPEPSADLALEAAAVAHVTQSEAVRLFVERATAASPTFRLTAQNAPAVAQVCRQLDGLPLAVELAAARVRALTVEQIAARLATEAGFRLLSQGARTAPPRQQTLQATLEWSYQLLAHPERRVLRRLSVFAGGFTLEAADAVCADAALGPHPAEVLDTLSALVDKSLVVVNQSNGDTRYHLLETIRQYAAAQLAAAGEAETARDSHLHYFARFAEQAEPFLAGPSALTWLQRYAAEHDNLRAALDWSRAPGHGATPAPPPRAQVGLQLIAASTRFLRLRGFLTEGRAHLSAALAAVQPPAAHAASTPAALATLARVQYGCAALAYLQSDYPAARAYAEECLALYRRLGPPGEAGIAKVLTVLGEVATEEGDYVTAPPLFEQSLAIWRRLGRPAGVADVLMQLGWVSLRTGAYQQAEPPLEEALTLYRQLGDNLNTAFVLGGLGEAALRQGQYDKALPLLEESLAVRRAYGDKWSMGTSLGALGWVALCQGHYARMRAFMAESLDMRLETGDKGGLAWCLEKLAEAALLPAPAHADRLRATRVYAAAAALRAPIGSVIDPADQPAHERRLAALRAALGAAAFEAAWAEGQRLPLPEAIAQALAQPQTPPAPPQPADYAGLTPRERQVAALLAQGKSNREIAAALVVGTRTAETYISRILSKLGFTSRVQIATWAIERGLTPPPPHHNP